MEGAVNRRETRAAIFCRWPPLSCYTPTPPPGLGIFCIEYKIIFLLIGITYFIVLFIADLYDYLKDFRQITNIVHVLIACWIGSLVVVLVFYFPIKGAYVGRSMMIIQAVSFSILVAAWRFAFSAISLTQRLQKRILIIGAGKAGRHLVSSIRNRPGCGFEVVGFVDDDETKVGTVVDGVKGPGELLPTAGPDQGKSNLHGGGGRYPGKITPTHRQPDHRVLERLHPHGYAVRLRVFNGQTPHGTYFRQLDL